MCEHCWHFIYCGDTKKGYYLCCNCEKLQTFSDGVKEIIAREEKNNS